MLRKKSNIIRLAFLSVLVFTIIFVIMVAAVVKSLAQIDALDDESLILIKNVPYVSQENILPTGCESACAVMTLHYYGFNTSLTDFARNYLDKQSVYYAKNNTMYGPSPYEAFAGSPYDADSYGCYAPVITRAVNRIVKNTDYSCVDVSGREFESLFNDYVANNIPVLVWVTINMTEPYDGDSWYLPNGNIFTWKAGEHCMVLIGEDENGYILLDPYKSNGMVHYDKSLTKARYAQMGSQAVVLLRK